jgi:digeranylgeranylglycerophospholipid reductase
MGSFGTEMVKPERCDVVVIGGGPAGLVAARDLARARRHVVVLEEHETIGRPVHCTGLVGLQAFDELDLSRESVRGMVASAAFRLNDGAPLVVRNERLRAAVIDRSLFDARLGDEARAAGAALRTGARVQRVDASTSGVAVQVQGGVVIQARAAVLACGANYRFNRALGLGAPRAYLQSAQVEVPQWLSDHVGVYFGSQLAPTGFGWVVPFARDQVDHARVGLMCRDRVSHRFRAFSEAVAAEAGVSTIEWPAPRMRLLPLGPVERTYGTRVLAAGDAAGLVKPTTGGGIYYSLLTGAMAARVLDERLADDRLQAADLQPYERMWRDAIGAEIRIGLAFRTLASRLSDRAIHALLELARVDGLVPLLNEHADFNWHRGAALALLRNPSFRRILLTHLWT